MDAPTIARAAAGARAAIGIALLAAPVPPPSAGSATRGSRARRSPSPASAVATSWIGLGTLWALGGRKARAARLAGRRRRRRPADLVGTLRSRRGLSTAAVVGTVAVAGGSAALHAWLQSELG